MMQLRVQPGDLAVPGNGQIHLVATPEGRGLGAGRQREEPQTVPLVAKGEKRLGRALRR